MDKEKKTTREVTEAEGETPSETQSSDSTSVEPTGTQDLDSPPIIQTTVMTIGEALEKLTTPSEGGASDKNNIEVIMISDTGNMSTPITVSLADAKTNSENVSKDVLNEIYLLNNVEGSEADSKDSIQLVSEEGELIDTSVITERDKGMVLDVDTHTVMACTSRYCV